MSDNLYEIPTCSICYEDMATNLKLTVCGHVFHSKWYIIIIIITYLLNIIYSIERSLNESSQCPVCRAFNVKSSLRSIIYEIRSKLIKINIKLFIIERQYSDSLLEESEGNNINNLNSSNNTNLLREKSMMLEDQMKKLKNRYNAMNKENDELKNDINKLSKSIKFSNVSKVNK